MDELEKLVAFEMYGFQVEQAFAGMRAYLDDLTKDMSENVKKIFTDIPSNGNPETLDVEWLFFSSTTKYSSYKVILYQSAFISCYSSFEVYFKKLCDIAAEKKPLKFRVHEMGNRDIIGNCKKYIEKIVDVDLESIKLTWDQIHLYRNIRNIMVHGSYPSLSDIKDLNVAKFIRDCPYFQKDEVDGFCLNSAQFIFDFTAHAETYLYEAATLVEASVKPK
jgi:hypothetical protein